MITAEDILGFLSAHKHELAAQYSVRRIGLFGSFRRGSANNDSDVDILVELDRPTFDNYMDLKFYPSRSTVPSVGHALAVQRRGRDPRLPELVPHRRHIAVFGHQSHADGLF